MEEADAALTQLIHLAADRRSEASLPETSDPKVARLFATAFNLTIFDAHPLREEDFSKALSLARLSDLMPRYGHRLYLEFDRLGLLAPDAVVKPGQTVRYLSEISQILDFAIMMSAAMADVIANGDGRWVKALHELDRSLPEKALADVVRENNDASFLTLLNELCAKRNPFPWRMHGAKTLQTYGPRIAAALPANSRARVHAAALRQIELADDLDLAASLRMVANNFTASPGNL